MVRYDKENNHHKYEVFLKTPTGSRGKYSQSSSWTWCKYSQNGFVLARGGSHGSLEACFASVRKHRDEFGGAPITINLNGADIGDAPSVVDLSAQEREVRITNVQLEQLQHWARTLSQDAANPPGRMMYLKIANTYAAKIASNEARLPRSASLG
jgi:hypothetical protein